MRYKPGDIVIYDDKVIGVVVLEDKRNPSYTAPGDSVYALWEDTGSEEWASASRVKLVKSITKTRRLPNWF